MAAQPFPAHAETLGTADWETNAPLWQSGSIWLGRSASNDAVGCLDDRHMVTVAGSRAGKGRSAIVPNLALWPGSCVVLDPKGENATKTARRRMQLPGHKVVVIDPFGVADVPDDLRGTFNPLDLIDQNDEGAVDIVAAIGDALVNAPACGSPVLFVMDEFASLGRLEAIEKAAGLMAGYGVKLWPILQDLTQLKRHYRESWETFLGNAGLLQFFGNTDLTTLEWLEKRMGQMQITITTEGSSVAEADGKSEGITQAETKGTQKSAGKTDGHSQMAPLSALSARQGGESIIDSLTRSGASDVSVSGGTTTSEALSASNSESKQTGTSKSTTETRSLTQSAQLRPLCRVDEIARYFDRDTGLQVVFISGGHPLVLKRTPYDTDPQFTGLLAN